MIVEDSLFFEDEIKGDTTFLAVQKHFPDAQIIKAEDLYKSGKIERQPFRGSMMLASKMGETFPFANALNWMPSLKKYILNDKYKFLDFDTIVRRANQEGVGSGLFIRPVSPLKEFSGQVFTQVSKLETEFIFATKNKNISPYLICVVAPAKPLCEEYRCVFVNREFIDGRMYALTGCERRDGWVVAQAVALAKMIAEDDYFINLGEFVLDIGYLHGIGFKLIEVNAFETSSFYTCDLDKIYKAWSDSFKNSQIYPPAV